jgi:uncharacterized protein
VPYTKALADLYVVGEFTSQDYPNIIPPGQRIETIAVPSVLAVYNWPKNSDRYRRIERFTQYLFARWDKLTQPPFHPRWRDVNLAATVPGWTRFSVSEQLLQRQVQSPAADQQANREFRAFVSRREGRGTPLSDTDRDALFREFLQWRERRQ